MADPIVVMAPYSYTWIFALTMIFAFVDGFSIGECGGPIPAVLASPAASLLPCPFGPTLLVFCPKSFVKR